MTVASLNMVRINRRLRESLQLQLYRQIRQAIVSGRLSTGVRLPSTRDLVSLLGLSRNTIIYAFDRLVSEGYLEGRRGSGIYVSALPLSSVGATGSRLTSQAVRKNVVSSRLAKLSQVNVSPEYPGAKVRPFRPCQPAIDLFPLRNWNRARSSALRINAKELMWEGDVAGLPRLRRALANYLQDSRGVRCEAEQIVITAGTQEALSLIAALLIEPNDEVWLEDPGYLGARAAFSRTEGKLVPVAVDGEGITIPSKRRPPKLIYTTPSRQFPRGVTMSLSRRLALLEFIRTGNGWIVEDDYDSEFRYLDRPMPSLQGLDQGESVIYVGSFSKVLFASLRLGYIVAPTNLVDLFRKLKEVGSGPVPAIDQATAALFIEQGLFATHIRRMRRLYRERRDAFLHEANKYFLGLIDFPTIDAGMDVMGYLSHNVSDVELSRRFRSVGIDAPPLSSYSLRTCEPGLLFGFTSFTPAQTRMAMQVAAKSIGSMLRSRSL
ncbi:MAG TPA: PLP-dependent aminotransferase family protein [Pyrinomonadaceae bacterium]|nr:PLP-dependent aminotransferase family protein [Pyrinomonadaceae bacterium]